MIGHPRNGIYYYLGLIDFWNEFNTLLAMTFTVSRDSCRICLELKSVMKPMITTYWKEIPYSEIFQQCTGFTLKINEISPVNVCNDCELRLIEFYKFKKKCCATEHILEKFLELDDYKPLSSMNNNTDLSLEEPKRLITDTILQIEKSDPIIHTNILASEENLKLQDYELVKNKTRMRTLVSSYKQNPKLKNSSLRNVKYRRKYVSSKNKTLNMQESINKLLIHKNIVLDESKCSTSSDSEQHNISQSIFSSPTQRQDVEKITSSPCKQISSIIETNFELLFVPENDIILKNIEKTNNSSENSSVDTENKVDDIVPDKITTCNSINVQISENNSNVENSLPSNTADVEPPVYAVISEECVQNEIYTVDSANVRLALSMEVNEICSTILDDPILNNFVREVPLPCTNNDDNLITEQMETTTKNDSSLVLICPEAQNTLTCSNEYNIRNSNETVEINKTHTNAICDEGTPSTKANENLSENIVQKVHDKTPVQITPKVGYSDDLDKEMISNQTLTYNRFLNSSHSVEKPVEKKAKELITFESKIMLINTDSVKKLDPLSKKINPVVSGKLIETNNLKQSDNQKKRSEKVSLKKLSPSNKKASNFVIAEKIVSTELIETADTISCKRSGKSDEVQTPNKRIKLDNDKNSTLNSIKISNYPKIILKKLDNYCNIGLNAIPLEKKNMLQISSDTQAVQANSKDGPSTPTTRPKRSSTLYIETISPTQRSTSESPSPLIQNYKKKKTNSPTLNSSLPSNMHTYFSSDIDYEKELDNFCVNRIEKPTKNNEIFISTNSTTNVQTTNLNTPDRKLKHKTKASMKTFDIQNRKVVDKLKNIKMNRKAENVKIIYKLNLPKINTIQNCTATPTTTLSPINENYEKHPSVILYSPNIIENSVSSHSTTCESFGTQEHDYERKTYDENCKQCTFCDAIFETSQELDDHVELHETQILYTCNLCRSRFPSMEDFENHKDICVPVMIEEKPHLCILCHETFTSEEDLNIHTQSHIDIRDMDDDVADYSFGYVNYN